MSPLASQLLVPPTHRKPVHDDSCMDASGGCCMMLCNMARHTV